MGSVNYLQTILRDEIAQMRFAAVGQAFLGPLHAETEFAAAFAATGDNDPIDSATQGVFDE